MLNRSLPTLAVLAACRPAPVAVAIALAACGSSETPQDPDGGLAVRAERVFATSAVSGCFYASPVEVQSQGRMYILSVASDGVMTALDPATGATGWTHTIQPAEGDRVELLPTPAVASGSLLVLGWQELDASNARVGHYVMVFDLETRAPAADFDVLKLAASAPTHQGAGTVVFDSRFQLMRSEIEHRESSGAALGLAYVALGNGPSIQPFHGWLFELDLDAWKTGTSANAIANVLITTAETNCTPGGDARAPMACGGGVWNAEGVVFYEPPGSTDYQILVPTGNGRVDFDVGAYAHSLLRTQQGLAFDPACDAVACSPFDELDPSAQCLASCKNIFVARLEAGDPPLAPEDGTCDGLTFLECYGALDADLGASAPVPVSVPDGPDVFVQPGKDGALYLIDSEHMGTLYQRLQLMDFCGTSTDPCRATWVGTLITQPAVVTVDGTPFLIVASVMADRTHPSGISAVKLVMKNGKPVMEVAWRLPPFSSQLASQVFRHHPGRPAIVEVAGEPYVAVVETRRSPSGEFTAPPGMLWIARVRDGELVAQIPLQSAGQRFAVPLVRDNLLYVNGCNAAAWSKGRVEAFQLVLQ